MKWMFNDKLLEQNEVKISASDHGFLYGVGLFETFRVYNGTPFLFAEHLERLNMGLMELKIKTNINIAQLQISLNRLLVENNLKDAYIRLTVTAGEEPLGLPTTEYSNPNVLWQIRPLNTFSEKISAGKKAVFLQTRRNLPETATRLKSLNFLNNVIAKNEIMHLENTEGIFLTNQDYVAEGLVSNIFFVKNNQVFTPSLVTGILNGITRQHIIKLCFQDNISINEDLYTEKDLINADEIFITNSIQEIVPIIKLEDKGYPFIRDSLTTLLAMRYKETIIEDCRIKGGGFIEQ